MIRTRFAPSPTGFLHIGALRTALYAFALAKHSQGEFLLRIEDTDQKREVIGASEKIKSLLDLFKLHWDQEIVVQSQQAILGVYKKAADQLLVSGHAFYSTSAAKNFKTDGYSTTLRDPDRDRGLTSGAIKLRVPDDQTITFHDFVLNKDITWDSNKVSDVVLLKSDGTFPTYHLAQAVDDHQSGITHVIRTSEWLTSTPVHVLIHQFLGYDLPQIGHPTAILDPEGGKLSKRKGNVSVEQFLEVGYLPEALLNFVMLLGWAPKDNRELFSLNDFVSAFDPIGFQKSNPTFNSPKLDWFNGHYIRSKSDTELTHLVKPFMKNAVSQEKVTQIIPLVKDRLIKLGDITDLTNFFFTPPIIDTSLFTSSTSSLDHLTFALENISTLNDSIVPILKSKGWKVGDFFMTLRIAICGSKFTPPLSDVIKILGIDETTKRLKESAKLLR